MLPAPADFRQRFSRRFDYMPPLFAAPPAVDALSMTYGCRGAGGEPRQRAMHERYWRY